MLVALHDFDGLTSGFDEMTIMWILPLIKHDLGRYVYHDPVALIGKLLYEFLYWRLINEYQ